MDEVLENFRGFLDKHGVKLTKKSFTSLLILIALLILLPVSIYLVKQQTDFFPEAAGQWIQVNTTGCVRVQNDKKIADCPSIPLKLINPFFGGNNTGSLAPSAVASNNINSPQPSSAASPSPATSGGGSPQNVNVRNFNNNIQQALDSIKSTGGSVYLPEGTYEIAQKVRLYSNTTLFGDGMGKTIIKLANGSQVDDLMANDSNAGQQNITVRDLTLQGPDLPRTGSCCDGLKFENLNGGWIINVEVNDVANDGIYLGYKNKNGTAQGVSNVRVTGCKVARSQRQQIGFTSGSNVVIDNCTTDGTNKHGSAIFAGIDVEPDTTTTVTNSFVLNNNVSGSNIGIALNGSKGESKNANSITNVKVCNNTVSGSVAGISDSGTNNTVTGNNSSGDDLNGSNTSGNCDMPGNLANIPAAPAKTTVDNSLFDGLIKNAFAEDSDDDFTDSENPESDDQFVIGSAPPGGGTGGMVKYRLAETQAGLSQAQYKDYAYIGPSIPTPSETKKSEPFNLLSSLSNWLTPNSAKAQASGGFRGVNVFGCGEILSTPAIGATEGDFVFRAPIRQKEGWETHLQNGTDINTAEMYKMMEGYFGNDWDPSRVIEEFTISCTLIIDYDGDCRAEVQGPGTSKNEMLPQGQNTTIHLSPNTGQSNGCDETVLVRAQFGSTPPASYPRVRPHQWSNNNPNGRACTDSDGGRVYDKLGVVTNNVDSASADPQTCSNNGNCTDADRCANGVLTEYYCDQALVKSEQITCPSGCQDNWTCKSAGLSSPSAIASVQPGPSAAASVINNGPLPGSSGTPGFSVGKQSINTTFQLTDTKPGMKQIWVQYLHPDGSTVVDNVQFELSGPAPQIIGLTCNLDVSKQNLNIIIEGNRFTNTIGTVQTVEPATKPEVTNWTDKQIIATLKRPNISLGEGQRFKVKVVRTDGTESGIAVCAVDKSLVSLGARIFCREPGKFDASDVSVSLIYNPENNNNPDRVSKIDEKVTIDKDGQIANLKTQLQVGKNYGIAIKAPGSLRKSTVFTAQEGTTEIRNADGSPFILPIGDIAPVISPDGQINTLDRAELIRQWRILSTNQEGTKLSGDFNRDNRVNSIDWACMNYDFGSSDDPVPVSIPQPASATINTGNTNSGSGTITIPKSSPSPSASFLVI